MVGNELRHPGIEGRFVVGWWWTEAVELGDPKRRDGQRLAPCPLLGPLADSGREEGSHTVEMLPLHGRPSGFEGMEFVDPGEEQVADLDEPNRALVDRLSATGMDREPEVGAEGTVDEDLAVDELLGQGVDAQGELRPEDRLDEALRTAAATSSLGRPRLRDRALVCAWRARRSIGRLLGSWSKSDSEYVVKSSYAWASASQRRTSSVGERDATIAASRRSAVKCRARRRPPGDGGGRPLRAP